MRTAIAMAAAAALLAASAPVLAQNTGAPGYRHEDQWHSGSGMREGRATSEENPYPSSPNELDPGTVDGHKFQDVPK